MTKKTVEKAEKLIGIINDVHHLYSRDYFESGTIEKVNLSRTVVPTEHVLRYRLNLHESINDYLMAQDLDNITYYYRVKTSESILDKIARYTQNTDKYPVNNWLNDIFGARMIVTADDLHIIQDRLDDWQDQFGLKNWYFRERDGYRGLHIYFKNKSNFYFPWELQLWDECDVESNIQNHRLHKRSFVS